MNESHDNFFGIDTVEVHLICILCPVNNVSSSFENKNILFENNRMKFQYKK